MRRFVRAYVAYQEAVDRRRRRIRGVNGNPGANGVFLQGKQSDQIYHVLRGKDANSQYVSLTGKA